MKSCEWCGTRFKPCKSGMPQRFCCNSCKQADYWRRKGYKKRIERILKRAGS